MENVGKGSQSHIIERLGGATSGERDDCGGNDEEDIVMGP